MQLTYGCVWAISVQNKSLNPKCCVCGFIFICNYSSFQSTSTRPHTLWILSYCIAIILLCYCIILLLCYCIVFSILDKDWRIFKQPLSWQRVSFKSILFQDPAKGICLDCVSDVIGYTDNNHICDISWNREIPGSITHTAFIKCISMTCLAKATPLIGIFSI